MGWGLVDNTLLGRQKLFFPHWFNNCVPTDLTLNKQWRDRAYFSTNKRDQKELRKMCSEDLLFYMAGFVNLFDAGDESGKPGAVPFIPYEFQVECLTALWSAMHEGDHCAVRVKKPRKLGLTWMVMAMFEHCWHFMDSRFLLVGSRKELEVDGSADSRMPGQFTGEWYKLLPKIDFIHLWQPDWLWPRGYTPLIEPYRITNKIMNPANGSMIWGTSAAGTAAVASGYAAFWDEAAHTENLYEIIGGLSEFAPCKLWVSSIGNLDHAFSTTLKDSPNIVQLSPEWWMHPIYSNGLTIDSVSGKRSSPWLERKLAEIGNDPVLANQEYFADETQQVGGFYGSDVFWTMLGRDGVEAGTVFPPLHRGELDIIDAGKADTPQVVRFIEQGGGQWMFWMHFDAKGRPPRGTRYIFGVDVAAGSADMAGRGASNSVIAVVDWMTGDLAAEYVTHAKKPYELARIAAAAGWWFEGDDFQAAHINFESNGPGAEFGESLWRKYGYPCNQIFKERGGKGGVNLSYGWHKDANGPDARNAFGLHREMICEKKFKERSIDCVDEMRHYQHNPNGKGAPVHSASLTARDPSGARENHGDRVMARIVAIQSMQERKYEPEIRHGEAPWGSMKISTGKEE